MVPLPPLRDGGCALPICPFGRACLPLISDAPDCTCSPGRLWFLGGVGELPGSRCTDFNPRARGGATNGRGIRACEPAISIHAPRVGRDEDKSAIEFQVMISIHAPRVGRDGRSPPSSAGSSVFQSTRPVWGATVQMQVVTVVVHISIHAPRVGRDRKRRSNRSGRVYFNPRAPCGARRSARHCLAVSGGFQSTRPVWGATMASHVWSMAYSFQSTRPVWGATYPWDWVIKNDDFNPRAPCGARPGVLRHLGRVAFISIHAPRVGRDHILHTRHTGCCNFNPRAPCGARQ